MEDLTDHWRPYRSLGMLNEAFRDFHMLMLLRCCRCLLYVGSGGRSQVTGTPWVESSTWMSEFKPVPLSLLREYILDILRPFLLYFMCTTLFLRTSVSVEHTSIRDTSQHRIPVGWKGNVRSDGDRSDRAHSVRSRHLIALLRIQFTKRKPSWHLVLYLSVHARHPWYKATTR